MYLMSAGAIVHLLVFTRTSFHFTGGLEATGAGGAAASGL